MMPAPYRYPALIRYSVALLAVVVTLRVRLALESYIGIEAPYLLFLAAVMCAGAFGGGGPALFATILGGLLGNYYFIEPRASFVIVDHRQFRGMLLFCTEGVFITGLCELM